MRWLSMLGAAFVVALLAAMPPAQAGDHLTGIVLMVPAAGEVVVHHQAFSGMPAMTMTFRVPAGRRLMSGDLISADVDRSADPWSLQNVRVSGNQANPRAVAEAPLARVGDRIGDTAFVDQRGRPLLLSALRGAPFAVSFMYTRCTDGKMCPLISAKFRALQQRLRAGAGLVEISLDPAYDRPAVLARYAAAYGADAGRWHLLTGEPRTVLDFAARFGILEEAQGPVKIAHSERLAIVDGDGRIVRFYDDASWSPNDVMHALRRAEKQVHASLQPGTPRRRPA